MNWHSHKLGRRRRRWSFERLEERHLLTGISSLPVLMVVANVDFYYQEYGDTRLSLEEAGYQVQVAATTTGIATPHPNSGQGSSSGQITPNLAISAVNASQYAAIVFVGGWGSSAYQYAFPGTYSNSPYNGNATTKAQVNQLINDFTAQNKYVTAICHGVTILAWARINGVSPIAGKSVCAYALGSPASTIDGTYYAGNALPTRWHVETNGATMFASRSLGNPNTATDDVYVDGRIITGENYDSARYFGQVIAQQLSASTPNNQPPVNTFPATQTTAEDTPLSFAGLVSIADPDAGTSNVQVTLSATGGTVAIANAGVTVAGNNSALVTATGTVANLNSALAAMIYTPTANLNGAASITLTTNDLGNTGAGGALTDTDTVSITISAVNDAPVLDASGNPQLADIRTSQANPGTTITQLLAGGAGGNPISDADSNAMRGIAITAVDTNYGSWEFTSDNGVHWSSLGLISVANARLLSDDVATSLRFVPRGDVDPAVFRQARPTVTFRAWDRTAGANGGLADVSAAGGSTPFSVVADSATVRVVTSSFDVVGNTFNATGTAGPDTIYFLFDSPTTFTMTVAGESIGLSTAQITTINIDGGGGNDLFIVQLPTTADQVTLSPGSLTIQGVAYTAQVNSAEYTYVYGDVSDTATFNDSAGSDFAYQLPGYTVMQDSNITYFNEAVGCGATIVNAAAGVNLLFQYGTSGNQAVVSSANSARMTGGVDHTGNNFEQVYIFGMGGNDSAAMTLSTGDDIYYGLADVGIAVGPAAQLEYLVNFSQITVNAGGGYDTAILFDAAGDDTYTASPTTARFQGAGFDNTVNAFDRVYAIASLGGNDVATLDGSTQDDTFYGYYEYDVLTNAGLFFLQTAGFELTHANLSAGGNDLALLYDSAGNETLNVSAQQAELTYFNGQASRVSGFDTVQAYGQNGGVNRRTGTNPVDYALQMVGTWT